MVFAHASLESVKIKKADEACTVFLACMLPEIPEDEAEYISFGAVDRMFRVGKYVVA